jgi:D-arabinose 1-dehydrogenase-like Zn-dependent alcohol dehydrogenase
MAGMRVVQVTSPNGPFELVERPVPEPPAKHVRINEGYERMMSGKARFRVVLSMTNP